MLSKHCCEMNSLRKTDLKKNFNLARTTTTEKLSLCRASPTARSTKIVINNNSNN